MAKEDIFSKINLKDYNNILENILEQKDFAEDVKNLLLSMLYKIENGYQDYKTVKVNVPSKKYFLEKIVQIIREKCKKIRLIKPLSEESQILEEQNVNYIVRQEEGEILAYPNERILLEALITLSQEEIIVKEEYELFKIGIQEVLKKGSKMNIVEVIRDFNGWSWDITTSQMEHKNINVVYQNLLILLGDTFLQTWITGEEKQVEEEIDLPNNEILRSKYNDSFGITKEDMQEHKDIDYIQEIQEIICQKYGEQIAKDFLLQLIKTVIAIGCNQNEKQKEMVLQRQNQIKQKLETMQDNKTYLEEISIKKRKMADKIKEMDTILNDEILVKKEYKRRNAVLRNEEKIVSISHLKIMLEKERQRYLEKIKQYNKQMQPKEFVKTKKELEEKMNFFQDIGIEEGKKVKEEKQINQLQISFLNCFVEKIKRAETKSEIRRLTI